MAAASPVPPRARDAGEHVADETRDVRRHHLPANGGRHLLDHVALRVGHPRDQHAASSGARRWPRQPWRRKLHAGHAHALSEGDGGRVHVVPTLVVAKSPRPRRADRSRSAHRSRSDAAPETGLLARGPPIFAVPMLLEYARISAGVSSSQRCVSWIVIIRDLHARPARSRCADLAPPRPRRRPRPR